MVWLATFNRSTKPNHKLFCLTSVLYALSSLVLLILQLDGFFSYGKDSYKVIVLTVYYSSGALGMMVLPLYA